ncbi:MAG: hypothetical protein L0387_11295 [Acidobacteria bacterium]|nr:hypothetical protein [Acidobacteriota bacterium]MCI0622231.1 hypothetical protein [Acidobacteriota bacterium]MCI0717949.1 hypothetical protein [Acidobacteriota bacterium]
MSSDYRWNERNVCNLVMATVSIFFASGTLLWIWLDRSPGQWDDSWYLTNSLVLFDTFAEGGLAACFKLVSRNEGRDAWI